MSKILNQAKLAEFKGKLEIIREKCEAKNDLEITTKIFKRKKCKKIKPFFIFKKSKQLSLKKKLNKFKQKFLFQFTEDEKKIFKPNRPNEAKMSQNFLLPWEKKRKSNI